MVVIYFGIVGGVGGTIIVPESVAVVSAGFTGSISSAVHEVKVETKVMMTRV